MLHVLPPPNEHSPTAGNPWRTLRPVQPRAKSSSCNSFAAKKRKYFIQKKEPDGVVTTSPEEENSTQQKAQNRQRSISECYFAGKGAALVLPQNESMNAYRKSNSNGGDIQQHLQSMFYLLRPEDTLKMAVKLESIRADRTRYLVVVSCVGNQNLEESCLLGVDCNETTTLGLVLAVWADVKITLDGDGGFSVSSNSRHHIFKPVSVQAMWSALQTLHKASEKATGCNYFLGGVSHSWIEYYEKKISSDRSCLNEWHAMDDLESRRPPSPENRKLQYQKDPEVTERNIRGKLREVMMTVDLDEVTSKHIRTRLEKDLHMDLQEYKSYIDQEMLTIMGQMDTSTEIFDHLFLGSEWNASNLEELQRNGVSHILNVTREIDNFFPGMFDYLNIRVYDEEGTELLKHWDTTYKFITDAKDKGSKVLVHCKMGVSRSASVVIAYIMKANNWKLNKAFEFVKVKRNCVQPNQSFMKQLETYQGILDASNHRHNTLWRSKSENNLKKQDDEALEEPNFNNAEKADDKSSGPEIYSEGQNVLHRPKSWSPDENIADLLFSEEVTDSPNISKNHVLLRPACLDGVSYSVSPNKALHLPLPAHQATEPVRFALGNDDSPNNDSSGSLSDDSNSKETDETEGEVKGIRLVKRVSSIKDRINELEILAQLSESKQGSNRDRLDLPEATGLVLNLASQFESVSKSNPSSPQDEENKCEFSLIIQNEGTESRELSVASDIQGSDPVISQTKLPATKLQAVLVRPETWPNKAIEIVRTSSESMLSIVTDESSETRRHSTNDLQSCKSESDVIMRLRVNNESKDLNVEAKKEMISRDADKTVTSNSSSYNCNNDSSVSPILTLTNNLETHKQSDIFSTNLDNIFNNEERNTAEKRSSQIISSCKLNSDIALSICDSAISTQINDLKSENDKHFDCNVTGAVDNSNRTMTVSRNNSKFGLPSSDLTPPQSWRTKLTKLPSNEAKIEDKCCDEDFLLKRASSLDGSLPSHSKVKIYAQSQAASDENQVVQYTSEIPSVIVIQRSQSLKNSSTSCKHSSCEAPKVFRIHGPKPYKKSPCEKQAPCILDSATIIANNEAAENEIVHYASAPILYKDNSQDYPMVPKSSISQPNIITSCSINCNSNILKKPPKLNNGFSKEHEEMDTTDIKEFDVSSRNYTNIPTDKEVSSCPGIVKQHKEVLENKIASSGVSNWPAQLKIPPSISNNSAVEIIEQIQAPINAECKQQCDKSEEWKILQSKLQLQMKFDAPDGGSSSGKVKRLTQKMEKATASNLPATSISSNAAQPVLEVVPDLIIIDQNGKEILPDLQHLSTYTEAVLEAISPVLGISNVISSPIEDKSVKTLVGKFEVKEKPLRSRYFSETEVENLSRGVSAESEISSFSNSADSCAPCNLASQTCNHQSVLTRKRSADCEIFGQSTKDNFKNDIGSFGETKLQENRNTSLSVKDKIPQHRSPLSSSVTGTSDEKLIAVENGVPHRKLRKAQGKSHPLSKLQNSNKQRHVSPFYYTM